MKAMKEFLEAINQYPWTSIFLCLFILIALNEISEWRKK